jgi:hypothetical protein
MAGILSARTGVQKPLFGSMDASWNADHIRPQKISSGRAESSEKQADIFHQQFRFFECGKMAPTGNFRPVLDIVSALHPSLGRYRAFPFRKTRNAARDFDVITFLEMKRGAVILVIKPA